MDLCSVTFRSFVVQWSTKITSRRPQQEPMPLHSVRVKLEFQLNTEKKVEGISRIKYFKCINYFY